MVRLAGEGLAGRQVELLAHAGAGGVMPGPLGVGGKLHRHPALGEVLIMASKSVRALVASLCAPVCAVFASI